MTAIFAKKALLQKGWADNVRLQIDDGRISAIRADTRQEPGDEEAGIVIPGLANAHSHAFQRALAGHTEYRGPADKDNFWTWRSRMYRLAGVIDAERQYAIARQAYSEMLIHGFTSVAEFHYLHSEPGAEASDTMLDAISHAASDAGIRLTYVPVLYERSGFDSNDPTPEQRRFVMSLAAFVDHYERAREFAGNAAGDAFSVGIGAHSLRAVAGVSIDELQRIAKRDDCPMHIHIAEQTGEVDQCLAHHGKRPVEWLLGNYSPDSNWCLVHATHMNDDEIAALAETSAVVCLCPSTEANLGDGLFPLQRWLERGGRIAIGSDSHITINPFEELRWLEYGQRLVSRSRNVAAIRRPQTGRSLFEQALEGGGSACGNKMPGLSKGSFADLVVLDADSPMLSGHGKESILDALVFSGFTLPIDRVMVGGRWTVILGEHVTREETSEDYNRVVREIADELGTGQ